jgi:hypothetical protein
LKLVSNKRLKAVSNSIFYENKSKPKSKQEDKMNMWIIAGIVISLVLVAGVTVMALQSQPTDTGSTASTISTAKGCGQCNGQCTAESGCGQATCAATQGKTCSCRG